MKFQFISPFMALNNADVHIQGLKCLKMITLFCGQHVVRRVLFHFIAAQPSRCDAAHRGLSVGRGRLFKGLGFKGRVG